MDAVLDLPTVMEGKKSTSVSEWGWGGQHMFGGVVTDLVPRTYLLNYYLLPVRKQEVMLIWCWKDGEILQILLQAVAIVASLLIRFCISYSSIMFTYLFIFFRKSLKDTVGFYSAKALVWNILQVGVLQDGCSRFLPDCFLLQGSLDGSMLHSRSSLSFQFEDMILFRHASVACLSQIEPFTTNDGTFAKICFIFTGNLLVLFIYPHPLSNLF